MHNDSAKPNLAGLRVVSDSPRFFEVSGSVTAQLGAGREDYASRGPEGLPTGKGSSDQLTSADRVAAGWRQRFREWVRWQKAAPIFGGVLERTPGPLGVSH